MQKTWVQCLDLEDPLEEGMATNSSILAWRIPMERGAWWGPWGHKELDMTEQLNTAQHRGPETDTEYKCLPKSSYF